MNELEQLAAVHKNIETLRESLNNCDEVSNDSVDEAHGLINKVDKIINDYIKNYANGLCSTD